MQLKNIALAAALATAFAPAFAADQVVDLSSGAASFVSTPEVLEGGDDVITFSGLADGTYQFLLTISAQYVGGLTGSFNGQEIAFTTIGSATFGYLESVGDTPFVLTLTGASAVKSLYSGELTVTAVPEPATYALLLAGLGVTGFLARRRRQG